MKFTKMEGAGNDYVYVDLFRETLPEPPETLAGKVADRHFGIGGDGLVLICPSEKADARMRMFNPDGSESEMCGNAIRCVAKYVYDHGVCRRIPLTIETGKGVLTLYSEVEDGRVARVRVDMGEAILAPERVPTLLRAPSGRPEDAAVGVPFEIDGRRLSATCVSMGNPHVVFFVESQPTNWSSDSARKSNSTPGSPAGRTSNSSARSTAPSSKCASGNGVPARRSPAERAPAPRRSPPFSTAGATARSPFISWAGIFLSSGTSQTGA